MASLDLVEEQLSSAFHLKLLKPDKNRVPALAAGVNTGRLILFTVNEAGHSGITALDISRKIGINKNTCLGYLRCLHRHNLIIRSSQNTQGNPVLWVFRG